MGKDFSRALCRRRGPQLRPRSVFDIIRKNGREVRPVDAKTRREAILERLKKAGGPVPAARLAAAFSVSRQIIVGDIALLRVGGETITATPKGYVLERGGGEGYVHTIACCHSSEDMEKELLILVDHGCTVEDVIVEHPVYGQISGKLSLSSRYDVSAFLQMVSRASAMPLSVLTGGIHLHTVTAPDEEHYRSALDALREAGLLVDENV